MIPSLSIQLPAVPTSVPLARAAIRAFAATLGAGAGVQADIELATSEAATNAVKHAYAAGRSATIRLDADLEDEEIELVIRDRGRGLARPEHPRRVLGVGLAMMREHTSAFQIRDRPGGDVEVWMRFSLGSDDLPRLDATAHGFRRDERETLHGMLGSPNANPPENEDTHEAEVERREHDVAERERRADAREWMANRRDRTADERERVANDRDRRADDRERRADEREGTAEVRERERLDRVDQAARRRRAADDRDQAQIDRETAASERAASRQPEPDESPTDGHDR